MSSEYKKIKIKKRSNKMNHETITTIEQNISPERFVGTPTEVPFQGIEYAIPDAEKDMWMPGV
jgi:hypothetical protein